MSEIFAIHRFGLLLRNDALERYRFVAMTAGAIAAVVLAASVLDAWLGSRSASDTFYLSVFYSLLFVGGPIAASQAFRELHDKTRNEAYLLLPASAVEKTLARLLIMVPALILAVPLFTSLLSVAVETVVAMVFGYRKPFAPPFDWLTLPLLGHAVVVQSLYFLGAAWFRKSHFLKTLLTLTLTVLAFSAFAGFLGWLVLEPWLSDEGMDGVYVDLPLSAEMIGRAAVFAYFFVLPPFCWVVATLRVRETQVSYGV